MLNVHTEQKDYGAGESGNSFSSDLYLKAASLHTANLRASGVLHMKIDRMHLQTGGGQADAVQHPITKRLTAH